MPANLLSAKDIGAIFAALIILGGMYAIVRNLIVFFADLMRGSSGKHWFDRPYLFRALAWIFSLLWLYGPYAGSYDQLHLTPVMQQYTAFGLYLLAAASWLWLLRISFLDGIPQHVLHLRTRDTKALSWHSLSNLTYVAQVLCAAALGVLFVFVAHNLNVFVTQGIVIVLLLLTGAFSLVRMNALTGADHSLGERVQHVLGGRDAGPPHTHAQ